MPSSYTTSLRLTLPATGELTGTWGTTVNTGITELLDAAVAGTTTISTWGGAGIPYTLSNTDGAADEARKMFIVATGAPGEAKNVICPAVSKLYFFRNDTTGGFALTLKTSGGSGIAVPAGQYRVLYCNGTNVVEAFNALSSLTLGTALAVTSGGTGTTTSTGTGSVVLSNSPTLVTPALGTPASGVLTNATGLPLTTGVTGTLPAANGGTGQSTYTAGDLVYATGATTLAKLGIGTNGQILTSTGTAPQWSTLSGVAVTTFSAGTTGFTPSTATSGAVTLAGTLATTNGGTGLTSFTANGVVYASSSSALTTGSALTFDGTTFTVGSKTSIRSDSPFLTGANLTSGGNSLAIGGEAGNTLIGFFVNNTEAMRLTSTGLGIGTSSPGAKVHANAAGTSFIASDIFQTSSQVNIGVGVLTSGRPFVGTNTSTNPLEIGTRAASPMVFVTDSTERMRLDASGNLGIGTSSPGYKLQVAGAGTVAEIVASNTAGAERIHLLSRNSAGVSYVQSQNSQLLVGTFDNYVMQFMTNNTTRMLLDTSGNLGIGTSSPSARLHAAADSPTRGIVNITSATGSTGAQLQVTQSGIEDWALGQPAGVNAFAFWSGRNTGNDGVERMRLDSSGNLGLGVTPSAWGSNYKAIESAGNSSVAIAAANINGINIISNGYADNSNWYYKTTGTVARYSINSSIHQWFIAPSGTAGNAISFTQAMTLDASGNLGVGTTSTSGIRLAVDSGATAIVANFNTTAANGGYIRFQSSGTSYGDIGTAAEVVGGSASDFGVNARTSRNLIFGTNNTERARITSGGDLLVGTTNTGAAGIGISNGANLTFTEGSGASYVNLFRQSNSAATVLANGYKYTTTANGFASSTGNLWAKSAVVLDTGSVIFYANDVTTVANGTDVTPTERARITSGGDFGIGTTSPDAKLDVVVGLGLAAIFGSETAQNAYVGFKYNSTTLGYVGNGAGVAAGSGATDFSIGSTGARALTFGTNDTERARITSGGALVVGNTAAASFEVLCASLNDSATAPFTSWNRATSGDNFFAAWFTEGTATLRGSIDYNRAGGLVRYNTTSDYRAKDIIGPITNSGEVIDSLKVYEGVMKGATQSRPMLIAHEAQAHAPYAVSGVKDEVNEDGTPKFQQIDVSSLVPLLLAEIQSLRARVAALEGV